ncbi:hypothetical protein RB200_28490 [Streptomyces sp. PmtG]
MAGDSTNAEVDPTSDVDPQQLADALAQVGPAAREEKVSGLSEERPGMVGLPADLGPEGEEAGPAVRRLPREAD